MKTHEQILTELMQRGIMPGASVKWMTVLNTIRYGCVLEILSHRPGFVQVQASNARLELPAIALTPAPEIQDVITADLEETYGPRHTWRKQG
jgi:hypothetical protein